MAMKNSLAAATAVSGPVLVLDKLKSYEEEPHVERLEIGKQEAFEKCCAHSPLRAAAARRLF